MIRFNNKAPLNTTSISTKDIIESNKTEKWAKNNTSAFIGVYEFYNCQITTIRNVKMLNLKQ